MNEGRVVVKKDGSIGRLIFDNPLKLNAISISMAHQLPMALADFEADPSIHVVVVTGSGDKSFISGADISEFDKKEASLEAVRENAARSQKTFGDLRKFSKPTVAGIRGFCFGGGVAIALACDLRFVADDSLFSIPAARLGIGYRADFTSWLVDAVGPANAKEILLTAQRYSAHDALRMGLVHRVASVADFDAQLEVYCASIAENAPLSMQASKMIVNEVAGGLTNADMDLCQRLTDACKSSDDYKEGRLAFKEKRRPVFRGI